MTTLYELLGALPNDDAEGLRAAFRKTAKATHPDSNPDDPEASLRFRRLVRAHEILSDAEQRAVYDQLLAVALLDPGEKSKSIAIYETMHKLASNTIAATLIAGVLIAGYALLGQVPDAPVLVEKAIEAAIAKPGVIAAIMPALQSDAIAPAEPRAADADAASADEMMVTNAAWPTSGAEPIPNIGAAAPVATNSAKSYRTRGIFAYRSGDLYRALADFDLAIQQDPAFAEAYVDRGIVLFRMRDFQRAFADMAKAKHIASSVRTRTAAGGPRKTSPLRIREARNVTASYHFGDAPSQ